MVFRRARSPSLQHRRESHILPHKLPHMAIPVTSEQPYRRFYWGLSLGIVVLALVGFVWFGWAISVFESPIAGAVCGGIAAILTGCLIWAGRPVRRKAGGLKHTDLRLGSEEERAANRRTTSRFRWSY